MCSDMVTTAPALCAYMRLRQIIAIVPFSQATIWRKVKNGSFPAPIKLSERVTAWKVDDVRAWLEAAASPDARAPSAKATKAPVTSKPDRKRAATERATA